MHKYILTLTLAMLILTGIAHAQGFIGETEQEIRNDFKDNPAAKFHYTYVEGQKYLVSVDEKAQMSFMFNGKGVCCFSLLYIYDQTQLNRMVSGFDEHAEVISKGSKWKSFHKGYTVDITLGYSTRMKATNLMFASNELHAIQRSKKTTGSKVSGSTAPNMSLGDFMATMPVVPTPNANKADIYTPVKSKQ